MSEDFVGAASQSIQAGAQVVKLAGEGVTVAVKGAVQLTKYMAALIKWLASMTAGQKLIRMGGELKLFRVDAADMEKFQSLCRKRGIVYQKKGFDDGFYDIILSSKQLDMINDVMKRLPSMQEIQFNGSEIKNKAVLTVNEDASRDLEKFLTKNDIYFRRISVSEMPDGQKQCSYYINPGSLKYVREYLDRQVANPKTRFAGEQCGAYTGEEFAEKNRHVVVVRADRTVTESIYRWALTHPDAGEVRMMESGEAALNDDALVDFLHGHPEFKDRIWTENYADYLCRPRTDPFPVEEDEPAFNRGAREESEAQKSVRILNAKAQAVSVEEMLRTKYPEQYAETETQGEMRDGPDAGNPEEHPDAFRLDSPDEERENVRRDARDEKAHLDLMAELGVVKKNQSVTDDGAILETYEKVPQKERQIRAFLEHDAAIQERLVREAADRAEAVGQQPDRQAARNGLRLLELPMLEEETEQRMKYRIYDSAGKEYTIHLRKKDLEIAPNGKRYAWIDPSYDYSIYSCEQDVQQRISQIREPSGPTGQPEEMARPGMNLAEAIRRGAAANPQPSTAQETLAREQQELTGRRMTAAAKNLSFEETADVLKHQREKAYEKLPQKNDFGGALNHSQSTAPGERESDSILCDRKNPRNYIRIHTVRTLDDEGNAYAKNDYRVYHNAAEVKQSEAGHNGRFTDERFEGRRGSYWLNLRREMQEKSGMSDDVLEFKSEQDFAGYYQKFLGSETYEQMQREEAAQETRARTQGGPGRRPPERPAEAGHRSRAVQNGTIGAFEERSYTKSESDALEAALLAHSRRKQTDIWNGMGGGSPGAGGKSSSSRSPGRKA